MILPIRIFFLFIFLFFGDVASSRKEFGDSCYDVGLQPDSSSSSLASSSSLDDSASSSSSAAGSSSASGLSKPRQESDEDEDSTISGLSEVKRRRPVCGPNEFFDCGSPCDTTCARLGETCQIVNVKCTEMCYCIKGYARNAKNVCVPIKSCPPKRRCGVNEEYSDSGINPCADTCKNPRKSMSCMGIVKPGCGCKAGFLKNEAGKCVALKDCDDCDGDPNAVFDQCGDPCPITCVNKDKHRPCGEICKVGGGCKCRPGFIRTSDLGKCIDRDDCPTCGPNEFFNCGSACDRTCATLGDVCPIINVKCNEMCYCVDDYARDADGVCIPVEECPRRLVCGENEEYNHCPNYCSYDPTCEGIRDGILPEICETHPSNWHCVPRCQCKPGYVREGDRCLEQNICCNDPNAEVVNCPNPCPGGTCENPNFSPCRAMCKKVGCQCKNGYVKNKNGKCIKLSNCPAKTCGRNEVYNRCPGYCTIDRTCDYVLHGSMPDCARAPDNWKCTPRCECKPGYVRVDGQCQEESICCNDPNAVLVQCVNTICERTCDNVGIIIACPAVAMCGGVGCECKEGYVKNKDGKCVLPSQCPKTTSKPTVSTKKTQKPTVHTTKTPKTTVSTRKNPKPLVCPENEEYFECPPSCPLEKICEDLFSFGERECRALGVCTPMCRCKTGYVRNKYGKCVLPEKCCEDPNSELVDEPKCCPGGTCARPEFTNCEKGCPPKGCMCKKGYLMKSDKDKTCVSIKECKKHIAMD